MKLGMRDNKKIYRNVLMPILGLILIQVLAFIYRNYFYTPNPTISDAKHQAYVIDSTSSKEGKIIKEMAMSLEYLDEAEEYIDYYENFQRRKYTSYSMETFFVPITSPVYIIKYSRDSLLVKARVYYTNHNGYSTSRVVYIYHKLLHKKQ